MEKRSERKIKILYFIEALGIGGTERQLVELLKHLDREKYQPIVACLHREGPFLQDILNLKVQVIQFGLGGGVIRVVGLKWLFQLGQFLRRERISIVHTYLLHPNFLGMLAASMAGTPVKIMSERIVNYFENERYQGIRFKVADYIAQRLADVIIVNAEAIKEYMIEQHGTPRSKIKVVYNGVDLKTFDVDTDVEARRSELGLSLTAPVLGIVASLQPKKDHYTFFEALRIVAAKVPTMQALIIGDGPLRDRLQNRVNEIALSPNVRFLGIRSDVPFLLPLLDVMTLSSIREGFPNAISEAMAARKPVVATDVGGVTELMVDGTTGLVVPPRNPAALAQAMLSLLGNEEKAREMGRAARKRVEDHFSVSRMVVETEQLYEELLESKGIWLSKI